MMGQGSGQPQPHYYPSGPFEEMVGAKYDHVHMCTFPSSPENTDNNVVTNNYFFNKQILKVHIHTIIHSSYLHT